MLDRRPEGHDTHQFSWLRTCILGNFGNPLPILANALIGLRAELGGHFAFDEMLCVPMLMEPLDQDESPKFVPRVCTDVDVSVVQEFLQQEGLKRIGKDVMHQAIDVFAYEYRFHPVREYLNGLLWDHTSRIESLFPHYFGAEDNEYTRAIGAMFLVS